MSDYLLFPALPYLEIDQKAIANITFFLTYSMFPVTTSAGWGYLHLTFIPWGVWILSVLWTFNKWHLKEPPGYPAWSFLSSLSRETQFSIVNLDWITPDSMVNSFVCLLVHWPKMAKWPFQLPAEENHCSSPGSTPPLGEVSDTSCSRLEALTHNFLFQPQLQ